MAIFFGPEQILSLAAYDRAGQTAFDLIGRPMISQGKRHAGARFAGQLPGRRRGRAKGQADVELVAWAEPHQQHQRGPEAGRRHDREQFIRFAAELLALAECGDPDAAGRFEGVGRGREGSVGIDAQGDGVDVGPGDVCVQGCNVHG